MKHLVAQLAGIAACMQLQWHFGRDAEKCLCNPRSLVQAEIKSLRGCGYKEKDLLPTAQSEQLLCMVVSRLLLPSVMPGRDTEVWCYCKVGALPQQHVFVKFIFVTLMKFKR